MVMDDLHQPVTNGKTKAMVFMSLVFIFVITFTSLIFMFTASFHLTGLSLWLMKGTFGTITLSGLAALIAVTRKFFDTRTTEIKAHDKLELKKESHRYKIEKYKLKQIKKTS